MDLSLSPRPSTGWLTPLLSLLSRSDSIPTVVPTWDEFQLHLEAETLLPG